MALIFNARPRNFNAARLTFLFAIFAAFASVGNAQAGPPTGEVKFEKGVYVKKGTVSPLLKCLASSPGESGEGYSTNLFIKAAKGERIRITLTSDTGEAVFSIYAPGLGQIDNGSDATSWLGTMLSSGDYSIEVYTGREFTFFTLTITKLTENDK